MRNVRYEEMKPDELERAVAEFPVAYCAFGSLEWHGRHLPVGTDALKAYNILIQTAQRYGGVVLPPTYWGFVDPWKPWTMNFFEDHEYESVNELYRRIFLGLVNIGFKVVIGVTGHDYVPQLAAIQAGVDAIEARGTALGFATMDGDLIDQSEICMDHAAAWETSHVLFARPDLVDMELIAEEVLDTLEGRAESGISGPDPRIFASKELGENLTRTIADALGQKARSLLDELRSRDPNRWWGKPDALEAELRNAKERRDRAIDAVKILETLQEAPDALRLRIAEEERNLEAAVENLEDAVAIKLAAHSGKELMKYTKRVIDEWPNKTPLLDLEMAGEPHEWWRLWREMKDATSAMVSANAEITKRARVGGERSATLVEKALQDLREASVQLENAAAERRKAEGDLPFLSTGPAEPFMDWVHREVIHTWQMPHQPAERSAAITPLEWYRVWEGAKLARLEARDVLIELERLRKMQNDSKEMERELSIAHENLGDASRAVEETMSRPSACRNG